MKKNKIVLLGLLVMLVGCNTRLVADSEPDEESVGDESNTDISGEEKEVLITYGNPITGADGQAMRKLVKDFNDEYVGKISVRETFTQEVEFYEALPVAIANKRSYDVALVHSYKVQSFANKEMLFPLQDLLNTSTIEINPENYLSNVFDAMYFNNELYSVPLDIHTIILYYNKTLLNQYNNGVVPTNRAELIAAAKKMPNTSQGGYGLPISTTWPSEYLFTTALYQNGGVETDQQSNPTYANATGVKALNMVADLIHTEHLSPLNVGVDADLTLFKQGRAMFHINGDWMLNDVNSSGIDFGVTTVSKMFTDTPDNLNANKVASRSHCFVLPQGRNQTPKQLAALTFIKYITEHASLWAKEGFHVPASNIARASEEYLSLPYQQFYGNVGDFTLNVPTPYYYEAYSPTFSRVTTALSNASYKALELLQSAAQEGVERVQEAKES
jgi:multiple sugar transport system substrate-binding protein